MSLLKHSAFLGSMALIAALATACQTQSGAALTGSTLSGPAAQPVPSVEIKQPLALSEMSSGTPFTIQWTYANLGAPQWKLFLNTGATGFVEQSTSPQCTQGLCSQSMTLYPGTYELIIREATSGIDDKVAFTVQ